MIRKKLSIAAQEEFGFSIIGIASKLNDYVLAHSLNKVMNINLLRVEDMIVSDKDHHSKISLFCYKDEQYDHKIYLAKNYSDGLFLLPSLKQFQYLLLFSKQIQDDQRISFLKHIRALSKILFVSNISPQQHKELPDLLDEIEIHLIEQNKKVSTNQKEKLLGARKARIKITPNKK